MRATGPSFALTCRTRRIRLSSFVLLSQILLLVTIGARPATAQDASSQIKSEAERLQRSIKEKPLVFPDFPKASDMVNDALKAALAHQSAGRLYLSLQDLGRAEDLLQGLRVAIDQADGMKGGLPAYEAVWEQASLKVTALDRQARERNWDKSPAAVQAISETAQGMTMPLLEGGRGFAVSTEPKNGLFYLGQAQGEADFAAFCATLKFSRKGTPYPLRSYLPELAALQEKTNTAFQPPRSIELHSNFIALNSAIKQAEELDAAQFYAGALYRYLGAVQDFGMLDAGVPDASQQAAVKSALAAVRRKLANSKRDDSIAQIFVESAESKLAHPDGSSPNDDDWKSARVIVEQALPAYFAAEKPPARLVPGSGRTVNLTLVRWPYT